jgi:hypothetical protein
MLFSSKFVAVGSMLMFDVASGQYGSNPNPNPLGTTDQRMLDELATKLHQQRPYDDLISEATQLFTSVATEYGYDVSNPVIQRTLVQAMDEIGFSSLQKAVNDDPAHPKVYSLLNPPRGSVPGGRYAYDNPDAIYRTIPISSQYDYVIRGKRVGSGPADSSFSLISNVNEPTNLAVLAGQDLVVESDGSFIITINNSTNSTSPNHISSVDGGVQLFIRNNIADGSDQVPDALEVEIRSTYGLPEPISEEEIIQKARTNIEESLPAYGPFLLGNQTLAQPQNVFNTPQQQSFGTLATQASSFSHFNISDTDAIVITFNPGASIYWVIPTTTLWTITDRPGERVESLNMDQAVANGNGTYTIVLSNSDPGVWNWIEAPEGGVGTALSRFQGFSVGNTGNPGIEVWSQVVPLDGLRSVLPEETKWVSQQEREAQLSERFASYNMVRNF